MPLKSSILDRLIKRLDLLDPKIVQGWTLKLVRERGLMDSVFQTIHEGVLIIDRELKMQYVNKAAIMLLGLPEDPGVREGQTINRYLKGVEWDRLVPKNSQEWQRLTRQEIEVFYPNHSYLELYIIPYKSDSDQEGDSGFATVILNDITEFRSRTESEVESEKIKTMTMLAAGVAHEIGNPLNSLTIHLQLLERHLGKLGDSKDTQEAQELLTISLQEVQRLDAITNRFLKAARPTTLDLKPVSLHDLVTETVNFMKKEIEDRGIYVDASWPKNIPTILGDDVQLKQAFYNIIRNAVQAMPEGGLLKIVVELATEHIVMQFVDQGQGIAAEDLSNIFSPYYTTKVEGSGLGLVIVDRIIREHGAELVVESDIDQGTVIALRFPLGKPRTPLLESHSEATDVAGGEPLNR